jgi:hypothetical protein
MTTEQARAELGKLAYTITDVNQDEAARRLLERLSTRDDATELRDALVVIGAATLVQTPRRLSRVA